MDNIHQLLAIFLHITSAAVLILDNGIRAGDVEGNGWVGSSKLSIAYTSLQAWKSSIKDDPNGITQSWIGSNVCSYKGIFCSSSRDFMGNPTEPYVSAIDLNHGNLQGTLVQELSLLTDMSILHLNSNRFSGTIPLSFRGLASLSELDLSNNLFSGPFPLTALYIPNLVYLDLRYNSFSGPIPEDVFNKRSLDAIFLNNNYFEGEIPSNLGNSPASVINLANNRFTGSIPFSLSYTGIKEVLFLNNRLTGCIPENVGIWTDLQVLDVSVNALTGHLPDSLSCLNQIEVMNFAHNKLSGQLPDVVCELRRLVNLTVSANFFSGLSQDCYGNGFVGFIDFSLNCIPGKEMQRPEDDCTMIPGSGTLSCLRIPKPFVCGAMLEKEKPLGLGTTTPP